MPICKYLHVLEGESQFESQFYLELMREVVNFHYLDLMGKRGGGQFHVFDSQVKEW
jgi:hypothetical protein